MFIYSEFTFDLRGFVAIPIWTFESDISMIVLSSVWDLSGFEIPNFKILSSEPGISCKHFTR